MMISKTGKILVVDDNESILLALKQSLKYEFEEIEILKSPVNLISHIESESWDIVLLDMNFAAGINSGNEGLYWLNKIKEIDSNVIIILMTAYANIELAVKGIKKGAHDFITKPWDIDKLIATLHSALKFRKSKLKVQELKGKQFSLQKNIISHFDEIIGSSKKMKDVFKTIKKIATTDANVLILGENGTGKELIAREIHNQSKRKNEVFISVDLGSVSSSLFESEMFGYQKGAFTGAYENRMGRIEAANEGTLFLDEIGNLPIELQAKILHVIQNCEVIPLGMNKSKKVNFRLICATNKNIEQLINKNEFREDLFYRINTIKIDVPPLRERDEDILLISEFFLKKYSKKYRKENLQFSRDSINLLKEYEWPGNVRELKHTIEKVVILSEGNMIQPEDLNLKQFVLNQDGFLQSNRLTDVEKKTIQKVLDKHNFNITNAARELDISRTTLYLKIDKYGL